ERLSEGDPDLHRRRPLVRPRRRDRRRLHVPPGRVPRADGSAPPELPPERHHVAQPRAAEPPLLDRSRRRRERRPPEERARGVRHDAHLGLPRPADGRPAVRPRRLHADARRPRPAEGERRGHARARRGREGPGALAALEPPPAHVPAEPRRVREPRRRAGRAVRRRQRGGVRRLLVRVSARGVRQRRRRVRGGVRRRGRERDAGRRVQRELHQARAARADSRRRPGEERLRRRVVDRDRGGRGREEEPARDRPDVPRRRPVVRLRPDARHLPLPRLALPWRRRRAPPVSRARGRPRRGHPPDVRADGTRSRRPPRPPRGARRACAPRGTGRDVHRPRRRRRAGREIEAQPENDRDDDGSGRRQRHASARLHAGERGAAPSSAPEVVMTFRILLALAVTLFAAAARATVATDVCPAAADPCVVSTTVNVAPGSTLDFGARTVDVKSGGKLSVTSGTMTILAGALHVEAGGALIGVEGALGGTIAVTTTGDIRVDGGRTPGRIDVDGDQTTGEVDFTAGGDIVLAGSLLGRALTDFAAGALVNLTAAGAVMLGGTVALGGGVQSIGGALAVEAGGDVTVTAPIDVSGGDGGDIDITSNGGDVTLEAGPVVNGAGDFGSGGTVTLAAHGTVSVKGGLHGPGAGSALDGGGDGALVDITADTGAVTLAGTFDLSGAPPDGTGGEIDVTAGTDFVLTGAVLAGDTGIDGCGGSVSVSAGGNVTAGIMQAPGGSCGGGSVSITGGGAVALNGEVDADGT